MKQEAENCEENQGGKRGALSDDDHLGIRGIANWFSPYVVSIEGCLGGSFAIMLRFLGCLIPFGDI